MSQRQRLTDPGDLRKYRTELPNLIDDMGLDSYEHRLYVHYKRVCGAAGGTCYESVRTTAKRCAMSTGQVSETRRKLEARGLIKCSNNKDGTIDIKIVDIWYHNFRHFSAPKENRCSPSEQWCSGGEHKCSCDEPKKKLLKKEPIKKDPPSEKTQEETMQEHFGPRPTRKKRPEDDVLEGLSPDERALALATGLAAREHERRGTRMAMTPEEEGRRLLLKLCEIHRLPVPKNKKVFARQANILVRLKNEAEAGYKDCVQALVFLKEDKTHGGFKSYNSVDEVRFQRDFRAQAFRIAQSRSQQTKPQKRAYSTTHLFTGEVTYHE